MTSIKIADKTLKQEIYHKKYKVSSHSHIKLSVVNCILKGELDWDLLYRTNYSGTHFKKYANNPVLLIYTKNWFSFLHQLFILRSLQHYFSRHMIISLMIFELVSFSDMKSFIVLNHVAESCTKSFRDILSWNPTDKKIT